MAGFSDNDIEKSPWAVGKAWAHDTLAYRGSNIWKCISVPDRGEDWKMSERVELSLFMRKEEGNGLHSDHFLSVSNVDSTKSSIQ